MELGFQDQYVLYRRSVTGNDLLLNTSTDLATSVTRLANELREEIKLKSSQMADYNKTSEDGTFDFSYFNEIGVPELQERYINTVLPKTSNDSINLVGSIKGNDLFSTYLIKHEKIAKFPS